MIDVYKPLCDPEIRDLAATIAFRQCGHEYGYRATAAGLLLRMPLLRALCRYNPPRPSDPPATWTDAKNCSFHFAWCYERRDLRARPPHDLEARFQHARQRHRSGRLGAPGSFRLVARGLTP